jgi:hypothetical protein
MRLKLEMARREGGDKEREAHQPKKEGHMEVSFKSQLELMQKLAKAEAKYEMVEHADARVDQRLAVQATQSTQLINTLTNLSQQAVGTMAGQLSGMHHVPFGHAGQPQAGHPQLQGGQAGIPQLQGPQAGHPQLQGPQAGFSQLQGPQAGFPQLQGPQAGFPQLQGPQAGLVQFGSMPQMHTGCSGFHSAFSPLPPNAESPTSSSSPYGFPTSHLPPGQVGNYCGDCGGARSASKFCPDTGRQH